MDRYLALAAVLKEGSVTKAADVLHRTQPAVTLMLKSLEKELGFTILRRSRDGVSLTADGRTLYPLIENLLSSYQQVKKVAEEIRAPDTGVIRIGTISSVSCHILPEILRDFSALHPNIDYVMHQGDYTSNAAAIKSGAVDLGFASPDIAPELNCPAFFTGSFKAVVPLSHPLAKQESVQLSDLIHDPFILIEEGEMSEPLDAFAAQGLTPKIKFRMHDDYSILSMVEKGLGISILAQLVLKGTSYQVKILPIEPKVTRRIGVLTIEPKLLSVAARTLVNFMVPYLLRSGDD